MLKLLSRWYVLLVALITLSVSTVSCNEVDKSHLPGTGSRNTELSMPVSVYLLKFSTMKVLDAHYTDNDVMELFDEVNEIWSKWGMTWQVDSIETVYVNENAFKAPSNGFSNPREFRNTIAEVIPDVTDSRQWRVYLVHQFPVNGSAVYISEKGAVLYGELNKNGERHPVILAHELGHSLKLRHAEHTNNLMYAGRGKDPDHMLEMDSDQIERAKTQAGIGPFKRYRRKK